MRPGGDGLRANVNVSGALRAKLPRPRYPLLEASYKALLLAARQAKQAGDYREATRCEERAAYIQREYLRKAKSPAQAAKDRWR